MFTMRRLLSSSRSVGYLLSAALRGLGLFQIFPKLINHQLGFIMVLVALSKKIIGKRCDKYRLRCQLQPL